MSDVFVSYKAEDRKRVRPLVEALKADGYSVWWDEQIGGGAQWRHMLEAELNAAKSVIVIWSKRSVGPEGNFVQDEASRAQARGVYVPVIIDKVQLPLGFGERQALPLIGWRGNRSDPRYEAVVAAVQPFVSPGVTAPVIAAKLGLDRRALLGGGVVAAAAVVGAGGWALLGPDAANSPSDSIAVLPFANLSGDPAQAFFSDGIAEELRSALARLAGLNVVGRTSSEAVRDDDAQTAAKRLGVLNILTGSVRQSPATIRVSAQLVDGRNGIAKWTASYDRSPGDVIKIQTDIAEHVATALRSALGKAARAAIELGGTSSAAAQELYLKANAELNANDSENSRRKSLRLLDSAIELDPKFARAYALKARVFAQLAGISNNGFEAGFVQAAAVARQAIGLAPTLAAGHFALASIRGSQLDFSGAAVEYERGHSLATDNVDDLLAYGGFLATIGRVDEAISFAKQAQARDRLNPRAFASEGTALINARRYAEALMAFRKAVALAPNRLQNQAMIGAILSQMGRTNEALVQLAKLPPDNFGRLVEEAVVYAQLGNRAAAHARLRRLQTMVGDAGSYQYAEIFAQLGETDKAFAALELAWSVRDPGLAFLKMDPWLDPLRSDPRFAAILQRINFPA